MPDAEELISRGEGHEVEFKESLRYDSTSGGANKALSKPIAKTVAAFLNSGGGVLLIGVRDTGEVVGIKNDLGTLGTHPTPDRFELVLRNVLALHLGVEVSAAIRVHFQHVADNVVAIVACAPHPAPVFFAEGDRCDLYIRDGNRSCPLDPRAAYEYTKRRWPEDGASIRESVKVAVREVLLESPSIDSSSTASPALPPSMPVPAVVPTATPAWLTVATRRVIDLFLRTLAGSTGWKTIHLISPWLSDIDATSGLSLDQFASRLGRDRATAYIVTRPPTEAWHQEAVDKIASTGRANIAYLPSLHMKLFVASTNESSFAMLGSANFTQQSLTNRELGVLVSSFSGGMPIVSRLRLEAFDVYRDPARRLVHKASFRA